MGIDFNKEVYMSTFHVSTATGMRGQIDGGVQPSSQLRLRWPLPMQGMTNADTCDLLSDAS